MLSNEIVTACRRVLNKIEDNPLQEELTPDQKLLYHFKESQIEPYDELAMKNKINLDGDYLTLIIPESAISDEDDKKNLQILIKEYFTVTDKIYRTINYRPTLYKVNDEVVNLSESQRIEQLKKHLNRYITETFTKLNYKEKYNKYIDEVKYIASKLMGDLELQVEDATECALRTSLYKDLFRNIAIPRPVQNYIDTILTDQYYMELFDCELINNLLNKLDFICEALAKVAALGRLSSRKKSKKKLISKKLRSDSENTNDSDNKLDTAKL